jgi:hypothetical protein
MTLVTARTSSSGSGASAGPLEAVKDQAEPELELAPAVAAGRGEVLLD